MVAKSFRDKKIIGEPFEEGNKAYVYIEGKTSNRKVRWYRNETEYFAAFPDQRPAKEKAGDWLKRQDDIFIKAFGFDKGYITVFGGAVKANDTWFRKSPELQYATHFGWFLKSTREMPQDIPADIIPFKLPLEEIMHKTDKEIIAIVSKLTGVSDRYVDMDGYGE